MMSLNGKSAPKAKPTPKDMFCAFFTFQGKRILDGNKVEQVWKFPNGNYCKNVDVFIISPSKTVWTNPFQHLVKCVGKGSIEALNKSYDIFLFKNKLKKTSMPDHAGVLQPLSTKDK